MCDIRFAISDLLDVGIRGRQSQGIEYKYSS